MAYGSCRSPPNPRSPIVARATLYIVQQPAYFEHFEDRKLAKYLHHLSLRRSYISEHGLYFTRLVGKCKAAFVSSVALTRLRTRAFRLSKLPQIISIPRQVDI
jgi:hypothetical protein